MNTLLIGIGNPIMSDDGVGIYIAQRLKEKLNGREDVIVEEASTGGLILVEMMLGYDRVFLMDAIKTKEGKVGDIYRIAPDDFKETVHVSSPHDVNFTQALEIWEKTCPDRVPKEIVIYAVEVDDVHTFSEKMSSKVEEAVPKVVDLMLREIIESAGP